MEVGGVTHLALILSPVEFGNSPEFSLYCFGVLWARSWLERLASRMCVYVGVGGVEFQRSSGDGGVLSLSTRIGS